jgi:hypothetical protein
MPMTKTFTQNDLIRFIYQETTEEEAQEINRVLAFDRELQLHYRELLLTKDSMDKARLEPSASTVANILRYARGLEVKQ